jgi:hypothetical protein
MGFYWDTEIKSCFEKCDFRDLKVFSGVAAGVRYGAMLRILFMFWLPVGGFGSVFSLRFFDGMICKVGNRS